MKFLIDSDLLLEAVLNRPNSAEDIKSIWNHIELEDVEAYITEPGLDKIISIIRALAASEEEADEAIELIQSIVEIAYVDAEKIQLARRLPLRDFESAIELVCAEAYHAVAVITHRSEEFEGLDTYPVPIWTISKGLEVIEPYKGKDIDSNSISSKANSTHFLTDTDCNQLPASTDLKNQSVLIACPLDSKPKSNLPEVSSERFVGREDVLKQLFRFLQADSPFQVISVCGEVGSGKTSAVLQAVQNYKETRALVESSFLSNYDAFILVPSIHDLGLSASPASICRTVSGDYLGYLARTTAATLRDDSINRTSRDEQLTRLHECLSRQKTLLILDGLDCLNEERSEIESFLKYLPSSAKVIITSRQDDLGYRRINLGRLNASESLDVIQKALEANRTVLKESEILQISQHCLGNPLAIKVAILQHTNYLGSVIWEKESYSCITDLFYFLAQTLFNSLKSKYAKVLLMVLAFSRNSFDLEVLTHFIGSGSGSEAKARHSLAELCRLSLVVETNKRYALNSAVRELVLLVIQQQPSMTAHLHKRLLKSYLKLAEKYAGIDWGDWHIDYDVVEAEWENLQSVLQWCVANKDYTSFQQLWKQLNHFADLYGYWSDRLIWLDCLIDLSKLNKDWSNYVFALSRKAWTLTMVNQEDSLIDAEALLDKAWMLRNKADFETQSYLAHHRVVFYIRRKHYKEAVHALVEQRNMLITLKNASLERRVLIRHQLNYLRDQAKLDFEQGRLGLAKKRYEIVLQKAQEINWVRGVCYTRNKLADIALRQHDLQLAEAHLTAGLPTARQNRNKRRLAGYEQSFAHLEKLRGDFNAAQHWAQLAISDYNIVGMKNESQRVAAAFDLSSI